MALDLAPPDLPGEGDPSQPSGYRRGGPSGPYAERTDADFSTIYPLATNHPLVSAPPMTSGRTSMHPRPPTPEDPRTQVSVVVVGGGPLP
ncbi:hypothetical protein PUR61_01680, partial [Streptomyces sp. BE20]|uniref:hypothetical protein n=1 Tax=Streptomyces sp. BE20 TaxID=3002525 RepID=UPI002E77B594